MAARPISTGYISFGLVNIPVKLFSTGEPSGTISFNMLHKKCKTRVKQQYVCPTDNNEVVPRDDIIKGYEFAKDQYVVFTAEELKAIEEERSKNIEITEFVPAEKVDAVYFDGSYYLGPDQGAERAYRLLSEAMRRSGLFAIARHAARGKQVLVLLRPMGDGLLMQTLRYADEVRPMADLEIPDSEVKEAELNLAMQFVSQLRSEEFHAERYEDTVKKRLQEIIKAKIEGQAVTIAPPEEPKAQVIDLMEALKASLAQLPGKGSPASAPAPASAQAPEPAAPPPPPPAAPEPKEDRRPPQRSPNRARDEGKGKKARAAKE
jgi:DNA end-binding protein Ku